MKGERYKSGTGNVFTVMHTEGDWVWVRQDSPGVFHGETFRWHRDQLSVAGMVRIG